MGFIVFESRRYGGFEDFFRVATGFTPFPYQKKLGEDNTDVKLLKIPTGAGKTASVILSWVWKRRYAPEEIRLETPKRLVYCLPMRVLVEQTYANVVDWLDNIGLLSGEAVWEHTEGKKTLVSYSPRMRPVIENGSEIPRTGISVYKLMGGEKEIDWDLNPEYDSVIVGTQDMLLSRALNRGYAVSRFRWPVQYGLLNNDCLWVMDEVQLMGSGFSTSVQLEAFRKSYGTAKECNTVWMSATCEPEWLETLDHSPPKPNESLYLGNEDLQVDVVKRRYNAGKPLEKAGIVLGSVSKNALKEYFTSISKLAYSHHVSSTLTNTLVIVNTVERAQSIYTALIEQRHSHGGGPEIALIHSRFRPAERNRLNRLLRETPQDQGFPVNGRIIISTQVVEAGVDISSCLMVAELSPWVSMVQRFGRLNRYGEFSDARAVWVDLDTQGRDADRIALPYSAEELDEARRILEGLQGVSLKEIHDQDIRLHFRHSNVLRRKDLLELYDTTPDLSGNDVDVSRYIRDSRDVDVNVYWRDWETTGEPGRPPVDLPRPVRDELCSVSVNSFREFQREHRAWMWDHLDERWVTPARWQIIPGQVFLVHCSSGGYDENLGWLPVSNRTVKQVPVEEPVLNDATGVDPYASQQKWVTLSQHTLNAVHEAEDLIQRLGPGGLNGLGEAVTEAVFYHDIGKAHPVFQEAALNTVEAEGEKEARRSMVWGKSGGERRLRYGRKYFRHELVSALTLLQNKDIINTDDHLKDLVIYLVGSHHGKVRLSIRSLPKEDIPWEKDEGYPEGTLFARGVWEGDTVPSITLAGNRTVPETRLRLDYMGLGLTGDGEPPWLEMMINLRDTEELGPFRLGYLEAITRVSDWRASIKESQGARGE